MYHFGTTSDALLRAAGLDDAIQKVFCLYRSTLPDEWARKDPSVFRSEIGRILVNECLPGLPHGVTVHDNPLEAWITAETHHYIKQSHTWNGEYFEDLSPEEYEHKREETLRAAGKRAIAFARGEEEIIRESLARYYDRWMLMIGQVA